MMIGTIVDGVPFVSKGWQYINSENSRQDIKFKYKKQNNFLKWTEHQKWKKNL